MKRKVTAGLVSTKTRRKPRTSPVDRLVEDRFRALIQDLHVGVAVLGPRGEVQFANQAATDIFRLSLDQAVGKTTEEITVTAVRDDGSPFPFTMRPVPQSIRSRKPVRNETVGFRQSGRDELFWILGSAVPHIAEDGSVERVIATFADISRWKQAEDRLRESEERFRSAFQFAAIGMALVALDGYWLRANDSFCRIVGYTEEELRQRTYQSITYPEDVGASEKLDLQLREGLIPNFHLEKRYVHKSGHAVWVLISISLVRDAKGGPLYYVAQVQDITDRKRAEAELRQLSAQLLALQEEERRRIARDLHDSFSQSLLAISLNLKQIGKRPNTHTRRQDRLLTETRQMVKGLARATRSLSYLLHPPLLDDLGLVSAIEEYAHGFSNRSGIRLALDLPSDMRRLPREMESALFRVIQESLANIQRHSGSSTAKIKMTWEGQHLTLEISDEGRGIQATRQRSDGARLGALGVGIFGMRERIGQLGGQLQVLPGSPGTLVKAMLPLQLEESDAGAHHHRR